MVPEAYPRICPHVNDEAFLEQDLILDKEVLDMTRLASNIRLPPLDDIGTINRPAPVLHIKHPRDRVPLVRRRTPKHFCVIPWNRDVDRGILIRLYTPPFAWFGFVHVNPLVLTGTIDPQADFAVSTKLEVGSRHRDCTPWTGVFDVLKLYELVVARQDLFGQAQWCQNTGEN